MIPIEGLIRAANRFELGIEKHGQRAWNSLSENRIEPLRDKEWLVERCSHGIGHLYNLIERIMTGNYDGDDDAGAVAWCGLVLSAAMTVLENDDKLKKELRK